MSNIKFLSHIDGTIEGNAATATKLATARTINGVPFDGTADITLQAGWSPDANSNLRAGIDALPTTTGNTNNIALGAESLYSASGASDNFSAGYQALYSNIGGSKNVAIGQFALQTVKNGTGNVAIGTEALANFNFRPAPHDCTAIGNYAAGRMNGYGTVALGVYAVRGSSSVASNTGEMNIGIGYNALSSISSGNKNIALGNDALGGIATGSYNIGVGEKALQFSSGNFNVGVGYQTLASVSSGSKNIALGYNAGKYQSNGSTFLTAANNSVYIGAEAKGKDNSDDNSIIIGYQAVGQGANTVVLGNDSIAATYLKGDVTATSFNSMTGLSSTDPAMNGTASAGISTAVARADHVHPVDTSLATTASVSAAVEQANAYTDEMSFLNTLIFA